MWALANALVSRFASAAPFAARFITLPPSGVGSVGERQSGFHRETYFIKLRSGGILQNALTQINMVYI